MLADLLKRFSKSDDIVLTAAQIHFLLFGNYYYSLLLVSNLESKKTRMFIRIQIFHLRQLINKGLFSTRDESQELIDSLDYQERFQTSLANAEHLSECALQFWRGLLNDTPDVSILNGIFYNIFTIRKKLWDQAEVIQQLNANSMEFFVKYGIVMRQMTNDVYAASNAFNILMKAYEKNLSVSYRQGANWQKDNKTMMMLISLETTNFMSIIECNTIAEEMLKCSRKDLIGSSIKAIMPPMIAQSHQQFIQRYYQAMESKSIGIWKLRFIKGKDNLYIPCEVFKNFVPRITGGFQGVMLARLDSRITSYSATRRVPTMKKVKFYLLTKL